MRRLLRWLKRLALGALALVVLGPTAALIVLHTDWGRERLRRVAEAQLARSFSANARIGRLEGSVLGELVARDVELRAEGGARFARVGALRIELALWPLLGDTVELDHLVAEDVEIYALRTIAPPRVEDPDPSTWSVELPAIEVRRARIVIEAADETVTLDGVDLDARASIPVGGPIEASARLLRGTWRERGAPLEGRVVARVGELVELPALELRVGGVGVRGAGLVVDPARPRGALQLDAPARAVARLVPGLELPADARASVTAAPAADGDGELALELTAELGAARLTGKLVADPTAPRARGVLTAKVDALGAITRGAHEGGGAAIVAFVADRARLRGTAIATGRVDGLPGGDAVVSFDAALDLADRPADRLADRLAGAAGLVLAAAAGGTSARGFAAVSRRADGALAIDAGRLVAATRDAAALAGAAGAPVRGGLALAAELRGAADPLDVQVSGTLDGDRLAYGEDPADAITLRRLHAGLRGAAKGSLARAVGEATGWVRGVARAGAPLGEADLGARYRADRTIAAWIRARPAAAEVAIAADATISLGGPGGPGGPGAPTVVALGDHAITLPGGERWTGRGGRVVVGPARVTLERLRTTNQGGRIEVGAVLEPAAGRLAVALDARDVAAASIDPAYRGLASGTVRLARRGLRWDGTLELDGRGLVLAPDASPLDAELRATIAGRRVVLAAGARTAALGGVRLELDVDGPPDLTDPDGWRRLPRAAVRSATLGVEGANLAAAAIPTGGVLDGTLYLAGADTTGTMKVRGVQTPVGEVAGDITFRPEDGSELGATSTVRVRGLGDADVSARIAFPRHPFDPGAWRRLGRGALAHLGASFSDLAIDPARLAALGVDAPYRALADVDVVIAGGATSATVAASVTGLSGGPLVQPIDLHVSATVDPRRGTRIAGHVEDTRAPARTRLASFEGAVPSFTLDRWLAAPGQARHAPITGGLVTVPGPPGAGGGSPASPLSAPALLAVLGRTDLAGGTILGRIAIGGTLGTPTGEARLALSRLTLARRVPGKPAPPPAELVIDARWGGAAGRITVTGRSGGGSVIATAEGAPADPAKILGSLTATDFDLAPLAALLPGELAAIEGKLGASLTARGLDAIGKLRGSVVVTRAVFPLDPIVGTLRDGTARARIDDRGLSLEAAGALGSGKISLSARSAGHELARIEATGKLEGVSPLGEWEPVLDADVSAALRRGAAGGPWIGTIGVTNASAVLPPSGAELGDPDKPIDLLFVEDGPIAPPRFALGGRPPDRPWLVADVALEPVKVKAEDLFDLRGEVGGKLRVLVGDTIGLVGGLEIENGIVGDLFGRRYTATGGVTFDGSLEPKVDITLQHKFPALVLTVLLQGDPATLVPGFRSDPASYTQDQLAGFFIGGEPGGDPSAQTRTAAAGAGAAVLSSAVGARIRKQLPIKIEQLGCAPESSVTAASCTVGRWFGEKLFVSFKRRLGAEENKNVNLNEVQGQYYLRRDLYLEMIGGDAGSGGLDLLWRRRW